MAIGAVIFSLPIALFGAFWVSIIHGYDAMQAIAVYSTLGVLTLLTVFTAIALASGPQE